MKVEIRSGDICIRAVYEADRRGNLVLEGVEEGDEMLVMSYYQEGSGIQAVKGFAGSGHTGCMVLVKKHGILIPKYLSYKPDGYEMVWGDG